MSLNGLNVLLAEDNPTNQMVAVQMLESLGASVTLAVDGADALEILEGKSFDVALIDIEMPRISGIDLIRRLRHKDGPVAEMPMIALTAYVMREHRAAIDDAGADGIIAKPILSIEQFGDDVLSFVRKRQERPGAQRQAVPRPAGNLTDGIDIDVFKRLCASFDAPTRRELMQKIIADIGSGRAKIETALQVGDIAELRASTHMLISVAGAIGATNLQSLSQCLNSAGHAADNSVIAREGPALLEEAARVLAFVRESMEE